MRSLVRPSRSDRADGVVIAGSSIADHRHVEAPPGAMRKSGRETYGSQPQLCSV
jgi:hypothetical protein